MSKPMHTPNMASYKAGANLSAKQFHFVKFGSGAGEVVACDTAGELAVGVLMNAPAQGETADVALVGGGAELKVAASLEAGDLVATANDGTGAAVDDEQYVCAVVDAIGRTTGAGDVVSVLLVLPGSVTPPAAG